MDTWIMRSLGEPYLPFFFSFHISVPYKVYNNTLTAESQVHRLNHKNLFSRRGSTHRNMNGYISFFTWITLSINVWKVCSLLLWNLPIKIRKRGFKTLGTSVIYSPIFPPSIFFSNEKHFFLFYTFLYSWGFPTKWSIFF